MSKPVILTGLRANNDLHLGNYLGALLPIVQMQKKYAGEYQVNLFVPDLHSFTTPVDHGQLQAQVMHNLNLFVAAGLDLSDQNTYLYRQSYIPAHSELTVILNSFTYMGELKRMTQFKEKSENQDNVSVGLFDYPVLMAADIILYGAKYVPLGEDQNQHVEIARDIALRLNEKFKAGFPEGLFTPPLSIKEQNEFMQQDKRLRVRDLIHPEKKMSKSDDSGKGVIFLGDTPDVAAKKVMGATTDSVGAINYDMAKQPGISNLLEMLAALTSQSVHDVVKQYQGQTQYGPLKQAVAEAVSNFLADFQAKLANVDDIALKNKLQASEKAMNETANQTLSKVQKAVGLRA
jgi:tryptophanyl-tRNA synthetase